MPGARRDSVAFTVVVTVLVTLGALLMLLVIGLAGAPSSLLLATALAALPGVRVVAVTDGAKRKRLSEICGQDHVAHAPVVLVWCADLKRLDRACELLFSDNESDPTHRAFRG